MNDNRTFGLASYEDIYKAFFNGTTLIMMISSEKLPGYDGNFSYTEQCTTILVVPLVVQIEWRGEDVTSGDVIMGIYFQVWFDLYNAFRVFVSMFLV